MKESSGYDLALANPFGLVSQVRERRLYPNSVVRPAHNCRVFAGHFARLHKRQTRAGQSKGNADTRPFTAAWLLGLHQNSGGE